MRRSRSRLPLLSTSGGESFDDESPSCRLCVSGSGQSTSTICSNSGASGKRCTSGWQSSRCKNDVSRSGWASTTGRRVVGRTTSPAGQIRWPTSAFSSVLFPVPVPPTTPTTSTRSKSTRNCSTRGAIRAQTARARSSGGHGGDESTQWRTSSTSRSKSARRSWADQSSKVGMRLRAWKKFWRLNFRRSDVGGDSQRIH